MKNPPFELTGQIVSLVAEIAELVGRVSSTDRLSVNPALRRSNRIKTVYGSLAIEQNTLTLDQVTAVLDGKRVLAPPKDIVEVRNAFEIYDRLEELDPYSADDLLTAHGVMMRGLSRNRWSTLGRCPNMCRRRLQICWSGSKAASFPC